MRIALLTLALAAMLLAQDRELRSMQLGSMLFTRIEVARNDEARVRGLMFRKELPCDGGMLFVFDREEVHSFWMRNTLIPLDIVFMDGKGVVTAIHTMKVEPPQAANESDEAYCARLALYSSIRPAKFALEINAGMASEVKVGDRIFNPQNTQNTHSPQNTQNTQKP